MTSSVSGFPCIEATRCLLTEVEMGLRLTVKPSSKSYESSHIASFTEGKSLKEEWYLDFDVDPTKKNDGAALRRVLQMRHTETGMYLSSDDKGRISCTLAPSDSCWWILQRDTSSNNSQSPEQDGLSDTSKSASVESMDDQYILVSKKYPLRRLCCTKGIEGTGEDYRLIASKNAATEPSTWRLKFTAGELCSIVNPVLHHHLRCNMYGRLSLTSQTCAWEVFRFIEAGHGDLFISSWIHFTKFLSSDTDGKVFTTDMESQAPGQSERWRVEIPPEGNGLFIQNVSTHRYLSVGRKRSEHLWTTTKPNHYAVWHLDAPQLHTYYLTSLFASAQAAGKVTTDPNQFYFRDRADDMHVSNAKEGAFLSQKKEKEEEWKVEVTPEGYFTFFSLSHEKYLGCNSKGDVHTTTSRGAWTLWEKKISPYGGVTFMSAEHNRFLAVTEGDNTLETTKADEEINLSHSWRIDPCIPRTISGGTGGYIAGAMGLNLPATMPFAVFGAVEADRATKVSKFSASHRPISAWKSWVKSTPSSSPPSMVLPSQSSVAIANSHIRRDAIEEGERKVPSPMKTNGEIQTSNENPKVDDETNDEKKEEENDNSNDDTNGDAEDGPKEDTKDNDDNGEGDII